jgi:hypothetical protein
VAEPARAEVHADPQRAVCVILEQVHVVVPAADGAELLRRELRQASAGTARALRDALEHRMSPAFVVLEAHPE